MNILERIKVKEEIENKNTGTTIDGFKLNCEVCGSSNILIKIYEGGIITEYTYDSNYISFKCKSCGNFHSINEED